MIWWTKSPFRSGFSSRWLQLLFILSLNFLPSAVSAAGPACGVFKPCPSGQVCVVFAGECRHTPARLDEVCGVLDPCASNLQCQSGRCAAKRTAGQSCSLLENNCQNGLVCDAGNSKCRHSPPILGEICGVLVPCAGDLTCIDTTCRERAGSGQACDRVVPDSCQAGLVCDAGSGTCRHNPPEIGETCGVTVPCAEGATCIAATCRERAGSGEACDRLVPNSCQDNLICDAGSGLCRHDPPQIGETCGLAVPCAEGATCIAGSCRERAASGETCDRLVSNSCQDGLVCDAGSGTCRHDPPELGETCGIAVSCADDLTCIAATCRQRADSGETCDRVVPNSCKDGLVCDAGSGTCRQKVPELGETCGVLVPCAGDLTCIAATCRERAAAGETCDRVVPNSCQDNLVCDAGSGKCRHDPPLAGETCGIAVPCAGDLTCIAATCKPRAASGESCDRVVTNSCQDGLICDAGSGTCRSPVPQLGETCGVLVPCAEGLTCFAATCQTRGESKASCDPLVANSCQDGLLCDLGSRTCRHEIPELGETCGLAVPCADDLTCIAATCKPRAGSQQACDRLVANSCQDDLVCDAGSGLCRHEVPELGETCGLAVPCAGDLTCIAATCSERAGSAEPCDRLVPNSCQDDLVCDAGSGLCRHEVPELGETCGLAVPCAGDLTCIGAICSERAGSAEACDRLVPDSCQDNLVCDAISGTCRHDPPLFGERCGPLVICGEGICDAIGECRHAIPEIGEPCGAGVACASGLTCAAAIGIGGRCVVPANAGEACIGLGRGSCQSGLVCDVSGVCRHSPPQRGEPCGQFVTCSTGLACDAIIGGKCDTPAKVGQTCIGLGQGNCESGSNCNVVFENGAIANRCHPVDNGNISPEVCSLFYSPALSNAARELGVATTFGTGGSGGAGIAATTEVGVAYGPNGEYGCYETVCGGVQTDASIGVGVCAGAYNNYDVIAGDSSVTVETVSPFVEVLSLSTAQVFSSFGNGQETLIGTANCVSLDVGILPLDIGVYNCTTNVSNVPLDSNADGLNDADVALLNLNPTAANGDSDGDGLSDIEEIGADTQRPMDSDSDGIIDALESGAAATSAQTASGVLLRDGVTLTIETEQGELLSAVGSSTGDNAPEGVEVTHGVISYNTTAPVGQSVVVLLTFSEPLPENTVVFKVDHEGNYSALPTSVWSLTNPDEITLTLRDGDPLTDLDGFADGTIDDPIAIGTGQLPTSGTSGGGGGCTVGRAGKIDPMLPGILVSFFAYFAYRRMRHRKNAA